MLSLKDSVRSQDTLQPETVLAIMIAHTVFQKYGYGCVVTSLADSKHMRKSLHYTGHAVDLRSRHVDPKDLKPILGDLQTSLGPEYDVILESDHYHLEYDPD